MNEDFIKSLNLPIVAKLPYQIKDTEDETGRKQLVLEFNTLLPKDITEEEIGKAKVLVLFNVKRILDLALTK